jgi:NAD(P)-dependent dehydrogenase (short-subunit alcohol dehydrogenase family)
VVLCAKSIDNAREPVDTISKVGRKAVAIQADPGKARDAEIIVEKALTEFGRLDILVNYGAARRVVGTIMEITESDFGEEMAADLKSVIFLSRCAIPVMVKTGGGSIVNVSSIAASGVKGRALRSASKAALNALTISMALDHGDQNVRVNAVLVGPTLTSDMFRRPEQLKMLAAEAPLQRLHTPEDVANAVVFLASDDAKQITGVLLPVDAGRSLPTF